MNNLSARIEFLAAQFRVARSMADSLRALAPIAEHAQLAAGVVAASDTADVLATQAEAMASTLDALAAWTEPPPPPPPKPTPPVVISQSLNMRRVVCFKQHATQNRYDRERLSVTVADQQVLTVVCCDFAGGGAKLTFLSPHYDVRCDGIVVGRFVPTAGATSGVVALDFSGVPSGSHELTIDVGPSESNPVWFIERAGAADDLLPAWYGSHDWDKNGGVHRHVRVPRRYDPTPRPLPPQTCTPFAEQLSRTALHRSNIVPTWAGNDWRPAQLKNGRLTTATKQPYTWLTFTGRVPRLPCLDGPRGVGVINCATDILVGRNGSAYVLDSWGLRKVTTDGTIRTLAGWRHRGPAPYHEGVTEADLELIGDWTAVAAAGGPIGFREPWRARWRPKSLLVDEAAEPIRNGSVMERPHLHGPQMLVADSQHGRVLLLTFARDSHDAPCVVTVLATGLLDPWGLAIDEDDWVYVTERGAHRIVKFRFDTPSERITMIQGQALAAINVNREVIVSGTLEARRAQPCVAPEGLDRLPGDDWLIFGGKAQQEVRRIHRYTHEVQTLFAPTMGGNTNFCQLAVSPGGFGPRGAIFVVTWDLFNHGLPEAWAQTGSGYQKWTLNASGPLPSGRGGAWKTMGYPSAVGVGADRMYCAGSQEGMAMIRQALPSDPALDAAAFSRGEALWEQRGYKLVHGVNGYGFAGLPLPWGEHPDIDAFLAGCEHTK